MMMKKPASRVHQSAEAPARVQNHRSALCDRFLCYKAICLFIEDKRYVIRLSLLYCTDL